MGLVPVGGAHLDLGAAGAIRERDPFGRLGIRFIVLLGRKNAEIHLFLFQLSARDPAEGSASSAVLFSFGSRLNGCLCCIRVPAREMTKAPRGTSTMWRCTNFT
jgi:hypothetical protein